MCIYIYIYIVLSFHISELTFVRGPAGPGGCGDIIGEVGRERRAAFQVLSYKYVKYGCVLFISIIISIMRNKYFVISKAERHRLKYCPRL